MRSRHQPGRQVACRLEESELAVSLEESEEWAVPLEASEEWAVPTAVE